MGNFFCNEKYQALPMGNPPVISKIDVVIEETDERSSSEGAYAYRSGDYWYLIYAKYPHFSKSYLRLFQGSAVSISWDVEYNDGHRTFRRIVATGDPTRLERITYKGSKPVFIEDVKYDEIVTDQPLKIHNTYIRIVLDPSRNTYDQLKALLSEGSNYDTKISIKQMPNIYEIVELNFTNKAV